MKFDFEAAKKAGYSEKEIQSFLAKDQPKEVKSFDEKAALESGYSPAEIQNFLAKQDISKTRSVISAPIKGLIKGADSLSSFADPVKSILESFIPPKDSLLNKVTEQALPTKDELAEQYLERTGKLIPSASLGGSGIGSSLLQAGAGAALGQLAKEDGIGETGQGLAEGVGMSIPGLAKAVAQKIGSVIKAPVERLASGLTKPRSVDAKFPKKAIISPVNQKQSIERLNEEAAKIAKKTVEKELPIVKRIEEGFDFESQFEQRFGNLQKIAEKANPDIDVSPVSKFMSQTASKYRGIPKLHAEGAKIKSEIQAFQNRAPTDLKSSLRTYRSNNKKIKGIYETSRVTGKQQEYVDFLVDYNKSLAKSFEETLPKDSPWVKEFKDTNLIYKQYSDARKTAYELRHLLGAEATPNNLSKLANDPKIKKKLSLSLGEKGANEISQIASDLKMATDSLRNIPAKELKWYESVLPLSILIPGSQVPGGVLTAKKGFDFARRGYGWFLSTSERRIAYENALKALASNNRSLYLKSAEELKKLLNKDED